jgi:hypothetical protein
MSRTSETRAKELDGHNLIYVDSRKIGLMNYKNVL